MIHHLLYYLDETDDKLAFNELGESHDMFAYLYSDRPNAPFLGMGGPCNAKSGITNTAMPEVALLASRARPWLPEGISSPPEGN